MSSSPLRHHDTEDDAEQDFRVEDYEQDFGANAHIENMAQAQQNAQRLANSANQRIDVDSSDEEVYESDSDKEHIATRDGGGLLYLKKHKLAYQLVQDQQ